MAIFYEKRRSHLQNNMIKSMTIFGLINYYLNTSLFLHLFYFMAIKKRTSIDDKKEIIPPPVQSKAKDKKQPSTNRVGKWGNKKIHEHPNAWKNGLDKNPQNINKDWPVNKKLAEVLKFLKTEGYEKITKSDIEEVYTFMLWLSVWTIDQMSKDEWNPVLIRSVALYIRKWWQDGLSTIEYVAKQALGPMQWEAPVQPQQPNNFLIGSAVMKFNQLLSWKHDETPDNGE